jgi:hypothetical protein
MPTNTTLSKNIVNWCKKKPRTRAEVMDHFDIPYEHRETLRRRLIEAGIKLRDARGRKKIVL